ncbi:MAG TPA: hypothetical protein PKC49_03705 [Phycisphaerae bacterium]|nr:hypothetical protein [Phycisphaerae bacterium]
MTSMLSILVLIPSLIATDPQIELTGEQVLANAIKARATVKSGHVTVTERFWVAEGNVQTVTCWEGYFDEGRFRLAFDDVGARRRGITERRPGFTGPIAVFTWDGRHILRELHHHGDIRTTYTVHRLKEAGWTTPNPRWLGLPGTIPRTPTLEQLMRADHPVSGVVKTGSVYRVAFKENVERWKRDGLTDLVDSHAALLIDSARGWSVVGFELTRQHAGGLNFRIRADIDVAETNGVWFPTHVQRVQFRNTTVDWVREETITLHEANNPLDESLFTWKGTGIPRHQEIISYATGVPHARWDGAKAVPITNRPSR